MISIKTVLLWNTSKFIMVPNLEAIIETFESITSAILLAIGVVWFRQSFKIKFVNNIGE